MPVAATYSAGVVGWGVLYRRCKGTITGVVVVAVTKSKGHSSCLSGRLSARLNRIATATAMLPQLLGACVRACVRLSLLLL